MNPLSNASKRVDRNKLAAALSVIPGLGHLYKHHYLLGICILIPGNLLAVFITALLSFATFGLSVVIVPALWFSIVGYSAYMASDEHGKHPWLHVWQYHWSSLFHRNKTIPKPSLTPGHK